MSYVPKLRIRHPPPPTTYSRIRSGLYSYLRSVAKISATYCLATAVMQSRYGAAISAVPNRRICYKAGKPKPSGYRTAMERLGTDTKNTLFVGDQIFTDIIGANLTGIRSILVAPIDPHEEIQIVLKRFIEKPVIACYKRHLKKVNK